MAERDERDRDRDHDRRRGHHRCRPHYGNIHDRLEMFKRLDHDEAVELLKTIIDSAFYQGVACCCMECKCEEHEEEEHHEER